MYCSLYITLAQLRCATPGLVAVNWSALIELCGTALTERDIAVENYSQALSECARLFGLNEDEQDSLGKLAIQRNRIAHRYLNFRWEAVCMFNRTRPIISKLITEILEEEGK